MTKDNKSKISFRTRIWIVFAVLFFRDNDILKVCPSCKYWHIASFMRCCTACEVYKI